MKVAHVAVAVKNLQTVVESIEKIFDVRAGAEEVVPSEKVKLQFADLGGTRFEFLEATAEDSPISNFINKRGGGIHHIAFYVDHLEAKLKQLKEKGIQLVDEVPKLGAEGCRVAFIHPKATGGILVELIERSSH